MASERSTPQSRVRKSDRTRQSILDAARTAFARKGFSGVTIRDITDLAQVTRANFYYYFRDKTELFVELGTATYLEALEVVESFSEPEDRPARPAIRDWVIRYFSYLDRNGAFVIRSVEDSPTIPNSGRRWRARIVVPPRRWATASPRSPRHRRKRTLSRQGRWSWRCWTAPG